MIDAELWLQTDQFIFPLVGHRVRTRPPLEPHPVTELGFEAKAVANDEVLITAEFAILAGDVQEFAEIAVVGIVI